MSRQIAIIEDETAIRENYSEALQRYGYQVRGYADRDSAEAAFAARLPDLVIIDIGLGDEAEGGFELCRSLRARTTSLPIMFLTARDSDLDAVSGLRLGADDYLTKDISIDPLLARVVALFRRAEAGREPVEHSISQGPLTLHPDQLGLTWNDRPVPLTVTEFWLVHALARYPGQVRRRGQLMDAASLVVDDTTVTSHIKRIRRKFQAVDPEFDRLETVYGAGYRWRA